MDMFIKIITNDLFYAMIIYIVVNIFMILFLYFLKKMTSSVRNEEKLEKLLMGYVIVAVVGLILLSAAFLQDIGVLNIEIIQMMKKLETNSAVRDLGMVIAIAIMPYFLLLKGIDVYRISSWKIFSNIDEDALGRIKLEVSFGYWGLILSLFMLYETAHMMV